MTTKIELKEEVSGLLKNLFLEKIKYLAIGDGSNQEFDGISLDNEVQRVELQDDEITEIDTEVSGIEINKTIGLLELNGTTINELGLADANDTDVFSRKLPTSFEKTADYEIRYKYNFNWELEY